ncbi:uroporphyrinogen-III C-methyltransferase [Nisaea sediminum]|uniref:uroporphyrinogen-III C-methyltransferase n=1 Tax=Nisaea sediminum TaxID=2775867 RepID=UPI001868485C|nr:uroporphyrinogen-III C-methyltransferase [Nisaea sediminum]
MSKLTDFAADFTPGSVWLVGAGPGHAGLLTLQAHAALQAADVIVYDALVGDDILALAPEATPREYAGKRGGKPSPKQADITLRLIQLARHGKRVLRLKGGDPFVFGRGGEEALSLVQAGVPFRICPGITAGIGGLAFAGIPLTHRDTNHAVTMITGHDATGNVTGVDWEAVAKGSPALVLYMAIKHIGAIAEKLIAAGRPADEPVAVVTNASLPEMSVLETTLGSAAADIEKHKVQPPAIVAVGEIVRLRSGLDWLGAEGGKELDPDPLGLGRGDSERAG